MANRKLKSRMVCALILTIFVLANLLLAPEEAFASANFAWAGSIGGINGGSFEIVDHMAIDSAGNVYATGHFYGTVDFDPGPGV